MSDPIFVSYISSETKQTLPIKQELGGFEIAKSGWVDIPVLIASFRMLLQKRFAYKNEVFELSSLVESDDGVLYKHIKAKYVVICIGQQLHAAGFFGKHKGTKGDTLIVEAKGLPDDMILKKGIYMVPLQANRFKVGATYNRDFKDATPQNEAAQELMQKFENLTAAKATILAHQAAIRPTTPDRKPLLGRLQEHSRVFIFNGLGTKGVTYGPFFATHLFNHIVHGDALIPEIDIKRYYK
jgi:glycine/D-amino acid oxidase-like deaminating enzyme